MEFDLVSTLGTVTLLAVLGTAVRELIAVRASQRAAQA
jgi:hypothetical protein